MTHQGPLRRTLAKVAKSYQGTISPTKAIDEAWSNRWGFDGHLENFLRIHIDISLTKMMDQ